MKRLNTRNKFRKTLSTDLTELYCAIVDDTLIWLDPYEGTVYRDILYETDKELQTDGRMSASFGDVFVLMSESAFWDKVKEAGVNPLIEPEDL